MQTSKFRLEQAKKRAADFAARYGESSHYADWRNTRAKPFTKSYAGNWKVGYTGPKSKKPYYCDSFDSIGLRDLGDAHKVGNINHTGWFCDSFQSGLILGRVLQLPSRDGEPCYIPATYCTEWDGVTLYPLDQYEDKELAASVADGYAEQEAEKAREYDAKDQAEQQIEQLHEEAREAIQEFRELKTSIKGQSFDTPVCSVIREKLRELREEVRGKVARIGELKADFWQAVSEY